MSKYHKGPTNLGRIRLLLLDVDGVMTDGRIILLPDGEELKVFSVYDGVAIRLAERAGLEVAFMSGRTSKAVRVRAAELGVQTVIQGSRDKLKDFEELLRQRQLDAKAVAFVGDDLPDLPVLRLVGFSAAPANAAGPVKYAVHHVTRARGGHGAVREVVDLILKNSGKWESVVEEERDLAAG